jgi:hypothetical protein
VDTWTFHRCEVLFEEQGCAYLPLTCLTAQHGSLRYLPSSQSVRLSLLVRKTVGTSKVGLGWPWTCSGFAGQCGAYAPFIAVIVVSYTTILLTLLFSIPFLCVRCKTTGSLVPFLLAFPSTPFTASIYSVHTDPDKMLIGIIQCMHMNPFSRSPTRLLLEYSPCFEVLWVHSLSLVFHLRVKPPSCTIFCPYHLVLPAAVSCSNSFLPLTVNSFPRVDCFNILVANHLHLNENKERTYSEKRGAWLCSFFVSVPSPNFVFQSGPPWATGSLQIQSSRMSRLLSRRRDSGWDHRYGTMCICLSSYYHEGQE